MKIINWFLLPTELNNFSKINELARKTNDIINDCGVVDLLLLRDEFFAIDTIEYLDKIEYWVSYLDIFIAQKPLDNKKRYWLREKYVLFLEGLGSV